MNIIQKLSNFFLKKKTEQDNNRSFALIVPTSHQGQDRSTQFNYKTAAEEGYKQVVWVYRCVQEILNRVSSVPWAVCRKNSSGEIENVTGHPLNELINQPNPIMSWTELLEWWVLHLNISGNAYLELSELRGNVPTQLYLLRPDRMKIKPGKTIDSMNYTYDLEGSKIDIPSEFVVHFKLPDPTNDYYGLSPLYSAARLIDTENASVDYNKNMFKNQARLQGIIQSEDELSDKVLDRIKSEVQSNWQGVNNAFKVPILEAGLKWVQTQLSPKEADFLGLRKLTREEICGVFGIPPVIVGILDRATYSNYSTAEGIFWNQTIIPMLKRFRDKFNARVANLFKGDVYIDYNLEFVNALRESQESLFKRAETGFKAGFLTQNEARQMTGFEAVQGGDVYMFTGTDTMTIQQGVNQLISNVNKVVEGSDGSNSDNTPTAPVKDLLDSLIYQIKSKTVETQGDKFTKEIRKRCNKAEEVALDETQKILTGHYKMIAKEIERRGVDAYKIILNQVRHEQEQDWEVFLKGLYSGVMQDVGNYTMSFYGESEEKSLKPVFLKKDWLFNLTDEKILKWIREITGSKIKDITDSTIDDVKTEIEEGLKNGESIKEITQRIFSLDEIVSRSRAERIAITEVTAAANAGSFYSALELPFSIQMKKVWLATGDKRTRPSHSKASGQKVGMYQSFQLDGGKLNFPGDSSLGASSKEIVKCRCVVYYDTSCVGA